MSQLRSNLADLGVEILAEDASGFTAPGFSIYIEDDTVQAVAVFGEDYQQKLLEVEA